MIRAVLIGGLGFLYLPLVVLVAASFNAARLAGAWGGFSLHWYGVVLGDPRMLDAAWLSLQVAVISASLATMLGGIAGHALARRGVWLRPWFTGLLAAPLVLPDLLIGFAFVLLFVVLGVPRGAGTIVLAHTTIGMAYVAVVVEARLAATGTLLEDAARDLGASAIGALLRITVPLAAPALLAGWLLAFTVSMDDWWWRALSLAQERQRCRWWCFPRCASAPRRRWRRWRPWFWRLWSACWWRERQSGG